MTEDPRPGMTEAAPRRRALGPGKWALLAGLALFAYAAVRNGLYLRGGLLRPDYGLIHAAYNLNFREIPLLAGAIAFAFWGIGFLRLRRADAGSFVRIGFLFAGVAAGMAALRVYVTHVEPRRLVVREVRLETPKLTEPLRILHISDTHVPAVRNYEKRIFERIRELDPDLILHTGDFFQIVPPARFEEEFPKLRSLMETTDPRFGIYGVYGDTERELYRYPADEVAPLRMLASRSVSIQTEGGVLRLHGLNLYQSRRPEWAVRSVEKWLEEAGDAADFRILLGHAPDFAMAMGDLPIDLCLAGHTHGGQVRLPGYGPVVIDSKVPREWARGFRRVGIPFLNVSAGAGSNRYEGLPPIRLNCPTEMTVIELGPAAGPGGAF